MTGNQLPLGKPDFEGSILAGDAIRTELIHAGHFADFTDTGVEGVQLFEYRKLVVILFLYRIDGCAAWNH